jgi:hypothetical protein
VNNESVTCIACNCFKTTALGGLSMCVYLPLSPLYEFAVKFWFRQSWIVAQFWLHLWSTYPCSIVLPLRASTAVVGLTLIYCDSVSTSRNNMSGHEYTSFLPHSETSLYAQAYAPVLTTFVLHVMQFRGSHMVRPTSLSTMKTVSPSLVCR